ncbi:MAG TPA: YetF domain-containing protein [Hydrogenophaga sp.]|nr:YetF domain-containing protein [Hydrogenophaga sp.]
MDTVLRIAVVYVFVLIGLRVLGKREFGQLSPLELVSLLMIPEIVSQAAIGSDYSLTTALTAVATLLVLVFVTSLLAQRFELFETLVSGRPTVLVHNGQFIEGAMNHTRVTPPEVFSEMHKAGLETLAEVKWAILEPDGSIAVIAHEGAKDRPGHPPPEQKRAL